MGLVIEIIFIVVLILIIIANILMRIFYNEFKEEENETKLSGFEIAKIVSEKENTNPPHIIKKSGKFMDHYNYERNVIKLSTEVFDGTNIYAAIIAIAVALETKEEFNKASIGHKISSFLVIASYILIVLGSFLNNANIIHFGFIIFILAFILEFLILNIFGKTENDIKKINKYIEELELIKPNEEYEDFIVGGFMLSLARLPFGFINYFR